MSIDQIAKYGLADKTILEIGCGKGEFLVALCERAPGARGIGLDPGYRPERTASSASDRIQFIRDYYGPGYAHLKADYVCCRHTLEHIPDVLNFMRLVRQSIGERPSVAVFFELPDMERVLVEGAFWDVYYEHCSYFTEGSLARLFRQAGFEVHRLWKAYDDQYLMLEASAVTAPSSERLPKEDDIARTLTQVSTFQRTVAKRLDRLTVQIRAWRSEGRTIAVWGSIRPPIEGSDLPGVHTCWTMADAANIVRLAEAGSHVVLLGAGFIGSIILESLVERRVNLTVVELGDRMVPRMMNATAGSMLKRWCESKGVNVRTSTSITRIERARDAADNRDTLAVELSDGHKLPAHLVIIAAGVSANMGFLNGSGIKTDAGILADSHLRTNHSNIFAAGDVAQGPDFSTGGYSVHAVQPTAADHGRIAAINMTGGSASFKGSLIMNVLDTVGLVSCSFGNWQGVDGGEQAERVDEAGFRYANLQFADDRLIGAITLGRTDWVGVLRGLIQTEVPLGPWKEMLMADPHRIAEAFIARVGA